MAGSIRRAVIRRLAEKWNESYSRAQMRYGNKPAKERDRLCLEEVKRQLKISSDGDRQTRTGGATCGFYGRSEGNTE